MTPFVSGDPDRDFWEQNPELKYKKPFNALYKEKEGSRIMWAIYLTSDVKSRFHRYGPDEKRKEISETYIKRRFKLSDYESYIESYVEECLTEKERNYKKWGDMLRDFDKHFDSMSFNTSLKEKMEMLKQRDKLWKSYIEAESSAKEELKYRVEGDRIESILESGEI